MDAEFWWRLDLSSPLVDIRRTAAVQMLLEPPPASVADELAAIAAGEDDAETRAMLQQVVDGYKKMPDAAPADSDDALGVSDKAWAGWSGSPAHRLEWLGRLPAEKRRELAGQAPERLRRERHPLVASALIRIFGRAWPEAHLKDLVQHASENSAPVCCAALETLRQRKSELMLPVLPALLTSDNPRIRGAAVRALAEIDPDEALAHLEALLLDPDPNRRLEGLRCCFHARFDSVMPLLLKAMAIETDARRLAAYGTLFEINPAPEAPFRLYELSERASRDCAEVYRNLIASSCRVIGNTLLNPDEFQKYREKLQTWIDRRAATGLAQEIVARAADGRGMDHDLSAMIESARKRPRLWEIFLGLATLPMPVAARTLFLAAVGGSLAAAEPGRKLIFPEERHATADSLLPAAPVPNVKSADCLNVLALLTPDDRETARREIECILSTIDETPASVTSAALRAAIRCQIDDQVPAARRALDSSHPGVVSAAVEYLGIFAPGEIKPLLDRFMASDSPRIKTAAVRVMQRSDPLQAVSALKAMLRSRQLEQQKLGVAALVHVEFSLVREALLELIKTNPPAEVLDAGLCLFHMNADPESVYLLYLLEKQVAGEASESIRKMRREMMVFLAASGRMTPDIGSVENDMEKRAEGEKEKHTAAPSAYSYRVLQKSTAPAKRSGKIGTFDFLSEIPQRTVLIAAAVLACIGLLAVAWNVIAGRSDDTTTKSISVSEPSTPDAHAQIRQVEGSVSVAQTSDDEFRIEADTGEIFSVPCSDYAPSPMVGARFRGALKLVRKLEDGVWSARRAAAGGLR